MIWLVGLGGSLGAFTRYFLGAYISKHHKLLAPFPLGTLTINLSGSFLLGVLLQLHLQSAMPAWVWFFLGIGFCGAFTTMSTFGYEAIMLLQAKKTLMAAIYVTCSVVFGLLAAALGLNI
jgi:fluoride exporter